MNETTIEWTDHTWNPASGCKVVSEGCRYCYAKTLAENKRGTAAFPRGFDLTIRPHKLDEPRRLKVPSRVFVNSMSDLFWEEISDEYRSRIIDVMWNTPQHQYQVLTKRPANMARFFKNREVPDNMWCGTTIESNRVMDRADYLRDVPAAVRFISAEPLLSDLDGLNLQGLHWVISGGESGSHLSDDHIANRRALVARGPSGWFVRDDRADWVRGIRDACRSAGVSFIHKQWGGLRPKSCGRELDGIIHDEYPRARGYVSPTRIMAQ